MPDQTTFRVLIVDLLGLAFGPDGNPSSADIERHIVERGARFHTGSARSAGSLDSGVVHFFYCPDLSTPDEIRSEAAVGYDAIIAAATIIPEDAHFPCGGVRIGAGTGNMRSASWGGANGVGGVAALMNTPGINSRATAQMAFKAILRWIPDLPLERLHILSTRGGFDTGRDLRGYPTRKLETYRLAVVGFGNIGREVARLGQAFGMDVVVHARPKHREWIEADGFRYAASIEEAADRADILSVHVGLGPHDAAAGKFANAGAIGKAVLERLNRGAILVNFDRGEVVDTDALAEAMATDRVSRAAIDADLFVPGDNVPTGPLAPYLPLAEKFGDRLLLLPHAAADTDHPSRLRGAQQAVDQILDMLLRRQVSNLVGTCPDGLKDMGPLGDVRILGPGRAKIQDLVSSGSIENLSSEVGALRKFLDRLLEGHGDDSEIAEGIRSATRLQTSLRKLGLRGPYAR